MLCILEVALCLVSGTVRAGEPVTEDDFHTAQVIYVSVLVGENRVLSYLAFPASESCEDAPVLGLIAHMDTSPAVSNENTKPRIVENYDGGDIVLNQAENIVFKRADFPEMAEYVGHDLIVTDGTTLLGGDDKCGIAEIMAASEYLLQHPEIKHGKLRIGFTPDEEIGEGTKHFDVELFGADFA